MPFGPVHNLFRIVHRIESSCRKFNKRYHYADIIPCSPMASIR